MKYLLISVILLSIFTVFGCSTPPPIKLKAGIDTPAHHTANGMNFLEDGKPADALREFNRAREIDDRYAPAYIGLGLVAGMRGETEKGLEMMRRAMEMMRKKQGNP